MSEPSDRRTEQYEHAGTWDCEACGEEFEVENKLDPLSHALSCGHSTPDDRGSGHEGYRRRQRELREAAEKNGVTA